MQTEKQSQPCDQSDELSVPKSEIGRSKITYGCDVKCPNTFVYIVYVCFFCGLNNQHMLQNN